MNHVYILDICITYIFFVHGYSCISDLLNFDKVCEFTKLSNENIKVISSANVKKLKIWDRVIQFFCGQAASTILTPVASTINIIKL